MRDPGLICPVFVQYLRTEQVRFSIEQRREFEQRSHGAPASGNGEGLDVEYFIWLRQVDILRYWFARLRGELKVLVIGLLGNEHICRPF